MASNELDQRIATYTAPIRITSGRVMALMTLLVHAAPQDLAPNAKRRLNALKKSAKEVESVQTARERSSPARLQGPRVVLANAFSAMHEGLSALARIPADVDEVGTRAAAIARSLFPEGVVFVKLEGVEAWAHSSRLIHRIEDEELEEELKALMHPAFMAAIRAATRTLGDAIGVGPEAAAPASSTALLDAVTGFRSALSAYVRALAAEVDEEDPDSIERFFSAVAPIDEMRSTRGAGGSEDEDEVEVTDPPAPPPVSNDPIVTEPVVTGPVVTGPVVTGPAVTDPIVTDPNVEPDPISEN